MPIGIYAAASIAGGSNAGLGYYQDLSLPEGLEEIFINSQKGSEIQNTCCILLGAYVETFIDVRIAPLATICLVLLQRWYDTEQKPSELDSRLSELESYMQKERERRNKGFFKRFLDALTGKEQD